MALCNQVVDRPLSMYQIPRWRGRLLGHFERDETGGKTGARWVPVQNGGKKKKLAPFGKIAANYWGLLDLEHFCKTGIYLDAHMFFLHRIHPPSLAVRGAARS